MMRFTDFSTESGKDNVTVFECTNVGCETPRQLAVLSGTYATAPVITSSTGFVKVAFTSDSSSTAAGFAALWSSVRQLF
jgi:hypothetical protein